MDTRDVQVLLQLFRSPLASTHELGRALRVTGVTVGTRLRRMARDGVLNGFVVLPAAKLSGRRWQLITYAATNPKPDLREVLAVDDVVMVWRGAPRYFMVSVYAKTSDAPPPPALAKILGSPPFETFFPEGPEDPAGVSLPPPPLDWRVMDGLLEDPRIPLTDLAASVGRSARTVRRHRDALTRTGALRVLPNVDVSRDPGLLVYTGYIAAEPGTNLASIRAQGMIVVSRHHAPLAIWILGHVVSYAQLQELILELKGISGVTGVNLFPPTGVVVATARLHGWIQEELLKRPSRPVQGPDRGTGNSPSRRPSHHSGSAIG